MLRLFRVVLEKRPSSVGFQKREFRTCRPPWAAGRGWGWLCPSMSDKWILSDIDTRPVLCPVVCCFVARFRLSNERFTPPHLKFWLSVGAQDLPPEIAAAGNPRRPDGKMLLLRTTGASATAIHQQGPIALRLSLSLRGGRDKLAHR
jgi:hypothetical protein